MKNDSNFISASDLPFRVLKANYKTWTNTNQKTEGYQLKITTNSKKFPLDTAYFSHFKSYFVANNENENPMYVATFTIPQAENDIILDKNPQKEFGNKVPNISKESPFELNQGEAVITFFYKGEIKYYKIFNIEEENN